MAIRKKGVFFEGWYLKHQVGKYVCAFIPGISIEKDDSQKSFIQTINNYSSHVLFLPEEFSARKDYFHVGIGNNIFSEKGIEINIDDKDKALRVKSKINYGSFKPLEKSCYAPSIIAPFSYLNFLECYHGMLSLEHELEGSLE